MSGNDDYLWDGSGPPDPEIVRLERALRPFGHRPAAVRAPRRRIGAPALLAAAALIGATLWLALHRGTSHAPYRIETLAGHVRVTDADGRATGQHPRPGDRIVSGDGARARLEIGPIGSVLVEADTRLRIENGRAAPDDADYMLYLEHGTVEASIFAAPRIFQVGTPSGIAVDLGCRYTATVEREGETLLRVISGAVAFETERRKVYVPEDAECTATPVGGPGTPVWQDHGAEFKEAVAVLDRDAEPAAAAAEVVFASSAPRDALTWFHLLGHADASIRERALDRIVSTVRVPAQVDLAAVAAREPDALDALLDELKWRWW